VSDANRSIGFVVILVLYLSIGIMAAAGCVAIGRRFLRPKLEQVFYGFFLVMIAAFYLCSPLISRSAPHGGWSHSRSLRSRWRVPPAPGSQPC
jgi:hypothetical protein